MEHTTLIQSIGAAMQWLGYGVVAVLATLKFGDLILKFVERLWKKNDDRKTLHESIAAKQIDSEDRLRLDLMKRVENLEQKVEEGQRDRVELIKANAALEAENKSLHDQTNRQDAEIKFLREEKNKQAERISGLESEIRELRARLDTFAALRG